MCEPFVSWQTRQSLRLRIQRAGLNSNCLPEHIVALQVFAFVFPALAVAWLLATQGGLNSVQCLLLGLAAGGLGMCWPRYWLSDLGRRDRKSTRLNSSH